MVHLGRLLGASFLLGCGCGAKTPLASSSCTDEDDDGYTWALCGGDDCNDFDEATHPGATPYTWALSRAFAASPERGFVASALAVDPSCRAHAVFGAQPNVYYSSFDGSSWQTETIAPGFRPVVVVPPAGATQVRTVFSGEGGEDFTVVDAVRSTDGWEVERPLDRPQPASAGAVGPSRLHVVAGDMYYRVEGPTWTPIAALEGNHAPAMAVDESDNVYLAYLGDTGLRYATLNEAAWEVETLVPDRVDHTIAVSPTGDPAIAVRLEDSGEIAVFRRRMESWVIESLPPLGLTQGLDLALAFAPNGALHLAFVDTTHHRLVHASDESGAWVGESIEAEIEGYDTSVVVDSSGGVTIAYSDPETGDLRLARRSGQNVGCSCLSSTVR